MKAYVIFSSNEPVLVLTRHPIRSKPILDELHRIGCAKFIAREVPVNDLRSQYGQQFDVIEAALGKGCDLRVLDYSGRRIFQYLPFSDFGPAYRHEAAAVTADATRKSTRASSRPILGTASPSGFG